MARGPSLAAAVDCYACCAKTNGAAFAVLEQLLAKAVCDGAKCATECTTDCGASTLTWSPSCRICADAEIAYVLFQCQGNASCAPWYGCFNPCAN